MWSAALGKLVNLTLVEIFKVVGEQSIFFKTIPAVRVLGWFLQVEDSPDVELLKLFYKSKFRYQPSTWPLAGYDILRDEVGVQADNGWPLYILSVLMFAGFASTAKVANRGPRLTIFFNKLFGNNLPIFVIHPNSFVRF